MIVGEEVVLQVPGVGPHCVHPGDEGPLTGRLTLTVDMLGLSNSLQLAGTTHWELLKN